MGYMANTTDRHGICDVTFAEIFWTVWHRVRRHLDRDEILRIIDQEISDSEGLCFTGRSNRLINSLNGFCRDVVIRISDNDQISAVINMIKKKMEDEGKYSVEECRKMCEIQLKELGVEKNIINEWLAHLE